MKKITLLLLALTTSFYVNSQTVISFEVSEGYTEGDINGQNGWGAIGGNTNTFVSAAQSSEGDQSQQLVPTNTGALGGGLAPQEVSVEPEVFVTTDMFVESSDGALSTIEFATQSPSQGLLTTRIAFNPDDTITVLDDDGSGALAFIDTGATFTRDTWFTLEIEHRFDDGEILYYIDENLIYTGTVFGGTNVEQLVTIFNNLESGAFYDNMTFQDGVLSTDENTLSENVSVFPNPTNGDLNINFTRNFGATNIDIINVNGQKVLNASIEGFGNNSIATSKLANGIYFAQISSETGTTTIKFIKN
ncbi:hypothetical protein GCM10011344_32500 [Dokdonia pacifica]|uniref:Por secretion system C-terminal sorting domain-containing protein n=1 Tax=Dokdonia pacifica TaxID=1627892 RepID=A0A239BIF5_9FLAO|nr:T9SS type A sorting domain-containing protein [Dokdonia pacifica]GGG29144.1 hypothetical protein GCM10011344_32500 [Dokdonia pacifica]SNS07885.1 Por secretion system C-terminal sorting domain-containing protein [Dokdonia pacifica]